MSIFTHPIGGGLGLPLWKPDDDNVNGDSGVNVGDIQVDPSMGPPENPSNVDADLNQSSAFNEAKFEEYLNNIFSGNLDYDRTLELLKFEQAFNREEAQKNRDFQKMMSNTSFQRAYNDLKQAGFNPALMVGLGGATTPTGSNAFSTSKNVIPSGNQMTQIINTLLTSAFKLVSQLIPNPNAVISAFGKLA